MKITDYSKIAPRYDDNGVRHNVYPDNHIDLLAREKSKVLDLGCGTGNYLVAQLQRFPSSQIQWYGLDANQQMLSLAQAKNLNAEFRHGVAEEIPYADSFFDYVVCRFAFHHFLDKKQAIAEIARVLRSGGRVRIENMAPEFSPDWLVYHYFPSAVSADLSRFWRIAQIESELRKHNLRASTSTRSLAKIPLVDFFREVVNRDVSQLNLISEEEFNSGKKKIENDLAQNPSAEVELGLTLAELVAQ